MTRVKICGCMQVADAIAARDAGADFIGILFAESRRRVSIEEAREIVGALGAPLSELEQDLPPAHIPATDDITSWFAHGAAALNRLLDRKRPLVVGVFEDQSPDEVNEISDETGIDLVQLSGHEPWTDVRALNRQAIKVIHPRTVTLERDITLGIESNSSLAVMLDASRGTGATSDLTAARDLAARLPIWLAGGLTPDNVAAAIDTAHPWLVDVSSGVETGGAKDPAKIAAFVAAAKGVVVR
jgi:phosphoribosylanthranilate isomerase